MKQISSLILALLIVVVCFAPVAFGKVVYVVSDAAGNGSGASWEDACTSISARLGECAAGDEIWVAAGRYLEAVEMEEGVAIYGGFSGREKTREEREWSRNETIIDAAGLSSSTVTGADNAVLDGFTVTGGEYAGVFSQDSSPSVINCTITGNTSTVGGGGVDLWGESSPTLTNCTIVGNTTELDGGGVYCDFSSPTLIDCTITGNTAEGWGGGVACSLAFATLINCTISENRAFGFGGGGVACDDSSATFVNSVISGNAAPKGGGLHFRRESSLSMTNCTITGNAGGGVYMYGNPARLSNCIVWNPGTDIPSSEVNVTAEYSCIQGGWPGEGDVNVYPRFVDPAKGDYRLRNGSPCVDTGLVSAASEEDLEGRSRPGIDGLVDMGAYESAPEYEPGDEGTSPSLLFVRADAAAGGDGLSWETALTSIAVAVQMMWAEGEVWVAAGTYHESIGMEAGVAIYGGFSGIEKAREERDWTKNETIIDAVGLNIAAVTGADDAVLDGCTVTGGENSGVYCWNSSPMIANCTITGNTSRYGGGGMSFNGGSSPVVTNCTITRNTAANGGGVFCDLSSPSLTDCAISGNEAEENGGGVYCWYESSPKLTDCVIARNRAAKNGGGVSFWGKSSPALTNCAITENAAASGGGVSCHEESTSPKLIDCAISQNTAKEGGGGVNCRDSSRPELTNCTISKNKTMDLGVGGGVCCEHSYPRIINCTISGNSSVSGNGGGMSCHSSRVLLADCTISGNVAGGNGGVVYIYGANSNVSLSRCMISENTAGSDGGVVYTYGPDSDVSLGSCMIWRNIATTGGAVYGEDSGVSVDHCIIVGNIAEDVGGIWCFKNDLTITNCTMIGNSGGEVGGIAFTHADWPYGMRINSCILRNPGTEIEAEPGRGIEVKYSCIQGGWAGSEAVTGNIDADPLFVQPWDGESADVHLMPGSPCIDAGDPDKTFFSDKYLPPGLGTSRCDMGVYGGDNEAWRYDIAPTPTPEPVGVWLWQRY
ncbi:MAG: right-handed parallel beta-helix repeat-containing protein [bacterium]